MAETEEKGVINLPQVVVICSRIPRPSRTDKNVITRNQYVFKEVAD